MNLLSKYNSLPKASLLTPGNDENQENSKARAFKTEMSDDSKSFSLSSSKSSPSENSSVSSNSLLSKNELDVSSLGASVLSVVLDSGLGDGNGSDIGFSIDQGNSASYD